MVEDFLYICDGAYTQRELIRMEMSVLKVVDFDLGIPLSYRFLRRYARVSYFNNSTPFRSFTRFFRRIVVKQPSFFFQTVRESFNANTNISTIYFGVLIDGLFDNNVQ